MNVDFDNTLEAQAEVELYNASEYKGRLDKFMKFEKELRNHILLKRKLNEKSTENEIKSLINDIAESYFENIWLQYETVTPAPDGHTMLQFQGKLDKVQVFIYIREL